MTYRPTNFISKKEKKNAFSVFVLVILKNKNVFVFVITSHLMSNIYRS